MRYLSKLPTHSRSRLLALVLAFALAPLSACGGGGSSGTEQATPAPIGVAPETAPSTYQINPAASWKARAASQDYFSGSLASVDLAQLGAGTNTNGVRTVQLQAQGNFKYNSVGQLSAIATGMFVDAAGKPVTPTSTVPYQSPSASEDCGQSELGDTVPEDFVIPRAAPLTLTLPSGAAALWLSVSDCFYKDNSLSEDPLRVTITVL